MQSKARKLNELERTFLAVAMAHKKKGITTACRLLYLLCFVLVVLISFANVLVQIKVASIVASVLVCCGTACFVARYNKYSKMLQALRQKTEIAYECTLICTNRTAFGDYKGKNKDVVNVLSNEQNFYCEGHKEVLSLHKGDEAVLVCESGLSEAFRYVIPKVREYKE